MPRPVAMTRTFVILPTISNTNSRVEIVHLERYEVVNLGAMILVVRQALVHLRALQIGEAAADLIHTATVDDEADDIVNANPGAFHARVPAADVR